MPWESKTVKELREEFVLAAKKSDNFSMLCREFDISRKTGYKWLNRYNNGESLCDQSRKPNHTANRTPVEVEELVLALRKENPGWGAKTLKKVLENQGYINIPCAKTINNILNRNGCISTEESERRHKYIRFQKEHSNEMWQTDFKGDFALADGNRCFPLDIIDDSSRYLIKIVPSTSTKNLVIPTFEEAFAEYGMPDSILSDNGGQFAGFKQGYTQFEKWLMCLDILPIHCRIKHPQTQGKIERFHRTLKNELLIHNCFSNIHDADEKMQSWRNKYNNIRPHEALDMLTPSDVYTKSNRKYSGYISDYEYSGIYPVLKVNCKGYISFDNQRLYFSETMRGDYIEFRPNPLGDSWIACFRNFRIAEFDTLNGHRLNRFIQRL